MGVFIFVNMKLREYDRLDKIGWIKGKLDIISKAEDTYIYIRLRSKELILISRGINFRQTVAKRIG